MVDVRDGYIDLELSGCGVSVFMRWWIECRPVIPDDADFQCGWCFGFGEEEL
jgi:hypothetical protein